MVKTRDNDFFNAESTRFKRTDSGDTVVAIDGVEHSLGQVLSVFPISDKDHFISIRDEHGNEIGIVEQAHKLAPDSRRVLREELERSYFLPQIVDVLGIDEHLNLFTFHVLTDRGLRMFEIRDPRQNFRAVGRGRYIIKDVDGNRYDIPKLVNLGPKSQNLLSEFV